MPNPNNSGHIGTDGPAGSCTRCGIGRGCGAASVVMSASGYQNDIRTAGADSRRRDGVIPAARFSLKNENLFRVAPHLVRAMHMTHNADGFAAKIYPAGAVIFKRLGAVKLRQPLLGVIKCVDCGHGKACLGAVPALERFGGSAQRHSVQAVRQHCRAARPVHMHRHAAVLFGFRQRPYIHLRRSIVFARRSEYYRISSRYNAKKSHICVLLDPFCDDVLRYLVASAGDL